MTDAPALTPALLPYGVKRSLTAAAAAAGWTAEDKASALRTLGFDFSAYYTKADIDTLLSAPSLAAFPVGSIYQSTDPASPAALFGGTWEQVASERVLMGASSTHAAGTTAEAGLPNITGTVCSLSRYWQNGWNDYHDITGAFARGGDSLIDRRADGDNHHQFSIASFNAARSSAVYGRSSTVQPAAYYVYIWHRVA